MHIATEKITKKKTVHLYAMNFNTEKISSEKLNMKHCAMGSATILWMTTKKVKNFLLCQDL